MRTNPALQAANAATFDALDRFDCIIDARSPAEFAEDHLPGAINCPVLDDQQRIVVGTLYKQVSPFEARRLGAALVAENIARHLRERFFDRPREWRPLIYCWRGGQRSGSMTTIFRQIGWDAKQLDGGYKAYRRHVVEALNAIPDRLEFRVIKGATGSAKTRVLHAITALGGQALDLEALANHKGSVLGLMPLTEQPSQKSFESALLKTLARFDPERPVFVEAESRKIGSLHVPDLLIQRMRASPGIALDAPRAARVAYLLRDYDYFFAHPDILLERLNALRPLRGNTTINRWRDLVDTRQWLELVDVLLAEHYDPLYQQSQDANYRGDRGDALTLNTESLDDEAIRQLAHTVLTTVMAADRQC